MHRRQNQQPNKEGKPIGTDCSMGSMAAAGLAFQILLGATERLPAPSLISGIRDGGLKSPPPPPSPPLCSLMISKRHRYSPIFRMKSGPSNDDGASRAGWRGSMARFISGFRRYRHRIYQSIRFLPTMLPARPRSGWPATNECGAPRGRSLCLSPFRPTHPLELIQIPMSHATTANQTMCTACRRVGSRNFLGSVMYGFE